MSQADLFDRRDPVWIMQPPGGSYYSLVQGVPDCFKVLAQGTMATLKLNPSWRFLTTR